MAEQARYTPGHARGAQVQKDGDKWTLILVRELRHPREKVWEALVDPAQLREWAPFDVDQRLDAAGGTVSLQWTSAPAPFDVPVTRADAPSVLEYGDLRWELEDMEGRTRLTLWHKIDHRFISWGAASWHIGLDALDSLLTGEPMGRIAGADAMKFEGWHRLTAEYAEQFGIENPGR